MLTRRGRAVVGVAGVAVLLALWFGARSLNAVVVPAAVALSAGYVQLSTTPDVTVERTPPGDAHVGETRTAELTLARRDGEMIARPFPGDVTERLAAGLAPIPPNDGGNVRERADGDVDENRRFSPANQNAPRSGDVDESRRLSSANQKSEISGDAEITFETAVGAGTLRYDVRYESRGRHELGPATVTATDAFGLFARETELTGSEPTLVYPRVRRLGRVGRRSLGRLEEFGHSDQRGEFAELREYVPGDPLRDINWKTTAKRDELIVTEFAAETEAESVSVAAGANADGADAMAEATASVVSSLVASGVPVDLSLPRGDLRVGPEYGGERAMLRTLATVAAGPVPDGDADVVIKGRADDASVDVRGASHQFSEMVDGDSAGAPAGVAA
ncbi:DUF58 domain-containing protein [Halolamina salifodinae]|uniref:Uncharacterized protein (DUF58 family) n=1 Tax=Halolamina salifodinae TaxID=1202767 RepID=A0A8T4GZM1_9EURY|nr:DUF58 domain-containing protein [Halolamina salifodinae]MBP1987573.1 uncharacterized protein (DUF58 family) [Halolamina salifodinae]